MIDMKLIITYLSFTESIKLITLMGGAVYKAVKKKGKDKMIKEEESHLWDLPFTPIDSDN